MDMIACADASTMPRIAITLDNPTAVADVYSLTSMARSPPGRTKYTQRRTNHSWMTVPSYHIPGTKMGGVISTKKRKTERNEFKSSKSYKIN